ncbi:TonB-dependent receptor domain-containing protein [Sphingomonas sp. SUN039]|uniref:TonB-dependent receptor domain-containing protein n=1 Tax=Sphingomonas sp. SUN039 TaxID=2937787 RepID=UPI0021642CD4|nr:TonB-dependent receptor [Sphingomonas sp. SUN039]UVO53923.1 TonB-dependent receptor [Sphingomonas sp. SUN039]
MLKPLHLARILLASSALAAPSLALAQATTSLGTTPPAEAPATAPEPAAELPAQEEVDISAPGANEIVVTGRRDRNIAKTSDQVVSVLGTAEIARTGEGNIAGALGRVTGLSVVGSGFVYVRGLGDRYSLALLNGSPLPSPEPLRRVVPLDIFPSGVIASSLVQKSYSANYPGEFGGGVINLTTRAVPREPFFNIGIGLSGDSETTGHVGYSYFGARWDNTGFDNGVRDMPAPLAAFIRSGARTSSGTVNTSAIANGLVTGQNAVVQRWQVVPNFSANITSGRSFAVGAGDLGIILAAGYSNKYTTRQSLNQASLSADVSTLESNFTQVNTDQRVVVNGLLGLGYEWDSNKIRVTNLYIRDTIKQARLSLGNRQGTGVDYMQQKTAWYERQLINSQFVGEFKLADGLSLDLRGAYANSQREAPGELFLEYVRTNAAVDPYGALFINTLNNGNRGDARITYSDLNEDLYSASGDLSYRFNDRLSATVGGAWSDTKRTSSRRDFQFQAPSNFPVGVGLLRPDLLLGANVINAFRIALIETDEGNPAFFARLRNYAGYAKVNAKFTDTLSLDAGVRYESATQTVTPIQVFTTPGASTAGTSLKRNYWLPAATLTWEVANGMQVRVSASKTIARPQFRELINQPYFDPDSNRQYRGNPLLVDSQLYNAEGRFEWYFAPEQRLSVSAFYKKIDKPIEAFITGGDLVTSFANAPTATLYGAEFELQKNFNLDGLFKSGSLAERRIVLTANYTYTKSKIKVAAGDTTTVFGAFSSRASDYFRDGGPLTGQSDHVANLQIGLEHPDRLSQQTILLSYASNRVVSRGLNGSVPQPDVIERPGFRLDFVAREGIEVLGKEIELKFEARNITGQRHEEFQRSGNNRIDINTYSVGTTLALSATVKFQ